MNNNKSNDHRENNHRENDWNNYLRNRATDRYRNLHINDGICEGISDDLLDGLEETNLTQHDLNAT